jgi:hypothetical protein
VLARPEFEQTTTATPHQGRDRILGFFFTDAPGADVVVVTDRGVELNTFAAK